MDFSVFYLQNRTHRAGAQTCLARILRNKTAKDWSPILVSSEKGWLTDEAERAGVAVISERFPRSRSLQARLYGNLGFARRVAEGAKSISRKNSIVHANDHLEGLLGLALAERLGAAKAIFLRSPGMTRDDYYKYRCNEYDLIVAVGDELQSRAQSWEPGRVIQLIYDGIEEREFASAKPKHMQLPTRILVIGSPLDWKGWADLTEALFSLEREGSLPPLTFDFTGVKPARSENDLKLERLRIVKCNFLGRVEAFRELVRGYDLVINPTRMESFGMAAIEVLAAGVPLLSSRTGVIEQVMRNPEMLFLPHRPEAIASCLKNVFARWTEMDFELDRIQENIRRLFLIDRTVGSLSAAYTQLLKK